MRGWAIGAAAITASTAGDLQPAASAAANWRTLWRIMAI